MLSLQSLSEEVFGSGDEAVGSDANKILWQDHAACFARMPLGWKKQRLPTAAPQVSQRHLRSRHPGVYPPSQ